MLKVHNISFINYLAAKLRLFLKALSQLNSLFVRTKNKKVFHKFHSRGGGVKSKVFISLYWPLSDEL